MSSISTNIAPYESSVVPDNRKNDFADLDEVRQAFCITYVKNGYKHRSAAVAAGLDANQGLSMKREPLCAAYIVDLQQKYLAESSVSKEMLDMRLDILEDMAMGEVEVPMITSMGKQIRAKKFHPELALKIYQERAKLHDFADEENKVTPVNVTINVAALLGTPHSPSSFDDKGVLIEQK